ncbi:SH3 domain-containing protein [Rhodobacter sp.]
MRNALLLSMAIVLAAPIARAEQRGFYVVSGVEEEDMLKMRAGPGTGYKVIVGLPNGTELWVQSCERSGSTSWCKVSLRQARGLKGYVSGAYLRKM